MKAAVYKGKNKIEIEKRSIPEPDKDEVLLKVGYCGICGTDVHIFHGSMDKRTGPERVIGHEMSGLVAKAGEDVTGFHQGDRVVARPLLSCGQCYACKIGCSHICKNLKFIGIEKDGAFQEYMTIKASLVHRIPDNLSLKKASLIEPIAVACHDVRRAKITNEDFAAVIGGGPIGMLIALIARTKTSKVLISDIDESRLAAAEKLGFITVNPKTEDIVEKVNKLTDNAGVNVVFEVSASRQGAATMTEIASQRARLVCVGIFFEPVPVDLNRFFLRELELYGARVYEKLDYDMAIQLAAENQIPFESIITAEYGLEELQNAFEDIGKVKSNLKTLIRVGGEM